MSSRESPKEEIILLASTVKKSENQAASNDSGDLFGDCMGDLSPFFFSPLLLPLAPLFDLLNFSLFFLCLGREFEQERLLEEDLERDLFLLLGGREPALFRAPWRPWRRLLPLPAGGWGWRPEPEGLFKLLKQRTCKQDKVLIQEPWIRGYWSCWSPGGCLGHSRRLLEVDHCCCPPLLLFY